MLFERFISKERNEPPDIDVDFENDRRASLKKDINILLGSKIIEEKSYADY